MVEVIQNGESIVRLVKELQMQAVTVCVERNLNQYFSSIEFSDGSILRFNRNVLSKNEPSVVLREPDYLS